MGWRIWGGWRKWGVSFAARGLLRFTTSQIRALTFAPARYAHRIIAANMGRVRITIRQRPSGKRTVLMMKLLLWSTPDLRHEKARR
jgi:hypothetical protein